MEKTQQEIFDSLCYIHENIRQAEIKAGRSECSVRLLAVSKFHPAKSVMDAIKAGQLLFGENRVQEAKSKFSEVKEHGFSPCLHIIGTLQRNKVKDAVKIAACIESVDRIELLSDIEAHCTAAKKNIKILFEYHTAEDTKSGFASFEELRAAVRFCAEGNTPHLMPAGFMTMAPFTDNESDVRRSFSVMRVAAEKIKTEFSELHLDELSMGMSGDYRIAIEEGSTQVRIGTAIFGERGYK